MRSTTLVLLTALGSLTLACQRAPYAVLPRTSSYHEPGQVRLQPLPPPAAVPSATLPVAAAPAPAATRSMATQQRPTPKASVAAHPPKVAQPAKLPAVRRMAPLRQLVQRRPGHRETAVARQSASAKYLLFIVLGILLGTVGAILTALSFFSLILSGTGTGAVSVPLLLLGIVLFAGGITLAVHGFLHSETSDSAE